MRKCQTPIIVAIDYPDAFSAMACIEQLDPSLCRIKIGKTLFVATGPQFIEQVQGKGFDVFLDLKFHDIPKQVAGAVKAATELGVWMLTLHASGGADMMAAAVEAANATHKPAPLIVAVTLLTSLSAEDIQQIGYRWPQPNEGVQQLAQLAKRCDVDGVVCSAQEASKLRSLFPQDFLLVTPGIRTLDAIADDQKRVMTPHAALTSGSDYLVIGRPITGATSPKDALMKLIVDINA